MGEDSKTDLFVYSAAKNAVRDYIIHSTPDLIQMAFGEMLSEYAKKEGWPRPCRLVAKNGKGALCVDFKVMPGARHAFADIPPNALLDPPWHLKLIGNDGREINRTLTLTREGRELVWACDGDEVERYGLLVLVKDPTVN